MGYGEVEIFINGKWDSYCFGDGLTEEEINDMNSKYWQLPTGSPVRYRTRNREIKFLLN